MIALNHHAVDCGDHRHVRTSGEQLGEDALMVRSEMLNHDERESVLLNVLKELVERLEPARRRADADHEEVGDPPIVR